MAAAACGVSRLPAPAYVAHPTSALVEVPYPPPPARVEYVPERPKDGNMVWLDGEWTWRGRRWGWKAGRWVVPPADAKFSPWTDVRDDRGTLSAAEGAGRDSKGVPLADPAPFTLAKTTAGTLVSADGEPITTAPNEQQRRRGTRDGGSGDAGLDASLVLDGSSNAATSFDASFSLDASIDDDVFVGDGG